MKQWWPILVLTLVACSDSRPPLDAIALKDVEGAVARIDPATSPFTVIYFLAPECPLCLNYTRSLRMLSEDTAFCDVRFIGVFSGEWVTANEVREFSLRHRLEFPMLMDAQLELAHALKATVTPEAFLIDSTGRVQYGGAIDNWVNGLGKKKLEVTEHFLRDAMTAALAGRDVPMRRTEAVGCLIE